MIQRYPLVVTLFIFVILLSCVKEESDGDLLRIGSAVLRASDMNAFTGITKDHPLTSPEFALGKRLPVTAFIECAALYHKQRFKPVNLKYRFSRDWYWKKRYILAVNFISDVLQRHLGYSDKELENYYTQNRSEFTSPVPYDSAGITCSTTVITPFNADTKRQIAEKLFLRDYRPDTAFLTANPHLTDENMLKRQWIKHMRHEGYKEVFFKKFFKEKYGTAYPDSSDLLVGKGKILSKNDIDALLLWLSEGRREMVKANKQSLNEFTTIIMRWFLFSEWAKTSGYASQPHIRAKLKWLWRYEVAQRYINDVIAPTIHKDVAIDSVMARFSYRDEYNIPGRIVDTTRKNDYFKRLFKQQAMVLYDEQLDRIRRDAQVTFLDETWGDGKNRDPAQLFQRADSLREMGDAAKAEELYRTLADAFSFTGEGKKALTEIAKRLTEKGFYTEAIRSYRRALIAGNADAEKQCTHMFMIGFIYDEYLNRLDMAESNYKWVLKNAPGCDYADEAEFMMLHLGERTENAVELQAEAMRQGR